MRLQTSSWTAFTVVLSACFLADVSPAADKPADGKFLWEIGKRDGGNAEFALAPGGYAKYGDDPLFVVGTSDAKRDWPYAHPGPADGWAGSRPHTFTVAFQLKQKPQGECRLLIDFVDTQGRTPPQLAVAVNGREVFKKKMPPGAGDTSIMGDPAKGKKHALAIKIPADALLAGLNQISIETTSGSWVLYDWLGFEAPAGVELTTAERATLVSSVQTRPVLVERDGKLQQTVSVGVVHLGPAGEATVQLGAAPPQSIQLKPGKQTVEIATPAVEKETLVSVEVKADGRTLARRELTLRPVRTWVVYLLPHSHVDIGYTHLQSDVEKAQWKYIEQAIAASRRTADYPPGAQFKWNVEVLWAVESYLKQATPEKQKEFIEAVQKGWIGLDALYGNELTALCRPEELMRLCGYAQKLSKLCGVKIDSAMISDVPGYTWGLMTVFGQAGVKYFSIGPNGGDRIGYTLEAWANKPFYWLSPDGRHKTLCWIPKKGYWQAFQGGQQLLDHLRQLEESGYPYDMEQIRYCLGDNAGPGLNLCEIVKDWNAKYAYPKLVIATTSPMMKEFEKRWGAKLPEARGDFTPYWEDGAASSADETAMNRHAAEELTQAEAMWAMLSPKTYPADDFYAAWRNVILYDEHTWGAHNSISQPDSPFVLGQWKVKQAFALDARKQSQALLAEVAPPGKPSAESIAYTVWNPTSWSRTDTLLISVSETAKRELNVKDPDGTVVPSQRLAPGSLVFLVRDIPAFSARRFTVQPGKALLANSVKVEGNRLSTSTLSVVIDEKTGAISSLKCKGIAGDFVDVKSGLGLNDFRHVPGKNPADAQPNGRPKITVDEFSGPLGATLLIESEAPGCDKLQRFVSAIEGRDYVIISDGVSKKKVRTKEGVHFAFPFNVPDGVMRMDIPWAVARPEQDQLPGACKNWFTVQRWIDVSNDKYGITWTTSDAPLVEVGAITAETPWIKTLKPSQTLFSYVMNNYWHTNYKADQEGPAMFQYALRPHTGGYRAIDATRFGIEISQPLVVTPSKPDAPAVIPSRLKIEPADAAIATLKPSDDRRAIIVRLFNPDEKAAKVSLAWSDPKPTKTFLSNLAEDPVAEVSGPIEVPGMGLVTLRAELP